MDAKTGRRAESGERRNDLRIGEQQPSDLLRETGWPPFRQAYSLRPTAAVRLIAKAHRPQSGGAAATDSGERAHAMIDRFGEGFGVASG